MLKIISKINNKKYLTDNEVNKLNSLLDIIKNE